VARAERGPKEKVCGSSCATGSRVSSGSIAECERRSWLLGSVHDVEACGNDVCHRKVREMHLEKEPLTARSLQRVLSGVVEPVEVRRGLRARPGTRRVQPDHRAREVVPAGSLQDRLGGEGARPDASEVVGEAGTGDDAVRLARSTRADVVLMDIRLYGLGRTQRTAEDEHRYRSSCCRAEAGSGGSR
jgi:CheY-like chemotaxis protein